MLDLLNAEVLEGTELKEVGGRETILTQHSRKTWAEEACILFTAVSRPSSQ